MLKHSKESLSQFYSNLLKTLLYMACKQFNILVLNFGIPSHYLYMLLCLSFSIKAKDTFHQFLFLILYEIGCTSDTNLHSNALLALVIVFNKILVSYF